MAVLVSKFEINVHLDPHMTLIDGTNRVVSMPMDEKCLNVPPSTNRIYISYLHINPNVASSTHMPWMKTWLGSTPDSKAPAMTPGTSSGVRNFDLNMSEGSATEDDEIVCYGVVNGCTRQETPIESQAEAQGYSTTPSTVPNSPIALEEWEVDGKRLCEAMMRLALPNVANLLEGMHGREMVHCLESPQEFDTSKVYVIASGADVTSHKKGNVFSVGVYQNGGPALSKKVKFCDEIKSKGIVMRRENCIGGHTCDNTSCKHLEVQCEINERHFYIGSAGRHRSGRIVKGEGEGYNVLCTPCDKPARKVSGEICTKEIRHARPFRM
jgi:hypothetical protein